MKLILSLIAALALVPMTRADSTVNISKVHLCCNSCVKGVDAVVKTVDGSSAVCDKAAGTIVVTAPDAATLQKVADALVKAGFYGESSDPSVKISSDTGAGSDSVKSLKVKSLKVTGVHLCCPKCVKAVHAAVAEVPGVTGDEGLAKGAESFTVTGDFKPSDVMAALQKAGLTGKVSQ
jgi:periplasmic mercuric ion binding protein